MFTQRTLHPQLRDFREQHEAIRARVAKRPSATLGELRAWLAVTRGVVVGHAAMWRTLHRLDLTRKKTRLEKLAGVVR